MSRDPTSEGSYQGENYSGPSSYSEPKPTDAPTMRKPRCEAKTVSGRPCGNLAQWTISYRDPEVPGRLRKTVLTRRCLAHSFDLRFFPNGASQIQQRGSWDMVVLTTRGSHD